MIQLKVIQICSLLSKFFPLISPNSHFTLFFNVILCFLNLYTCFTVNLDIFFDDRWYLTSNVLVDLHPYAYLISLICFLLQIFLNFNTGFYKNGQIIMKRVQIILNYLKTRFLLDIISLSPLLLCSSAGSLLKTTSCNDWLVMKMLVFLKIFNMQKIFRDFEETLSLNEQLEGILSFFKLIFKLGFMAHILACLWNKSADFDSKRNWIGAAGLESNDWPTRYLYSLYWSVTTIITVGYGDIAPKNPLEVSLSILAMIFGCGIFGYSINSVGTILQKFQNKENILR